MKLQELLSGVEPRAVRGDVGTEINAITSDSRKASKGSLFIAIPGLVRDGSEFVDSAIEKGAAAVVTQSASSAGGAVVIEVEDARAAQAIIAANYFGRPADKLTLVGVTGTSGKTTTTKMVEAILDATGEPVGLIGTIEYRAGEVREVADRTTPDAIALQQWFSAMVDERVRRAVMEVSSHALSLKRTHGVEFSAAVFTNLSRDHLDFHKDFEDYFSAKKMLFSQLKPGRNAVVNIDDDYGRRLADELGERCVRVGRGSDADIRPADDFIIDVRGLRGTIITPSGSLQIDSPLIGVPNLYNWMCAIGAALAVGIDAATISRGVASLASVRGRFERVGDDPETTILVDYAHKPDALEKLLHTARELAPGRELVVIFGCGGDRDQGKRAIMGEIAARLADRSILTSDNPRSEKPEVILQQIEEGVKSGGAKAYEVIADRRAAIERGVELASGGAVVIIAGKGHENYQVVGDQIVHFDDREEVELALRRMGAKS